MLGERPTTQLRSQLRKHSLAANFAAFFFVSISTSLFRFFNFSALTSVQKFGRFCCQLCVPILVLIFFIQAPRFARQLCAQLAPQLVVLTSSRFLFWRCTRTFLF